MPLDDRYVVAELRQARGEGRTGGAGADDADVDLVAHAVAAK